MLDQTHLNDTDRINTGAYYTQDKHVRIVYKMIRPYLDKHTIILDNSCGYGHFLTKQIKNKKIGNDVDVLAYQQAKTRLGCVTFFNHNALYKIHRQQYGIGHNDKLCIIGNPPYNDKTSLIKNQIKSHSIKIDDDVKTRDLGMSFLLSYNKLKPRLICVLHPLSYLIKASNFKLLKKFNANYKLLEGHVFSSASFKNLSKFSPFPIVIALYKQDSLGMTYQNILDFSWDLENKKLVLGDFDDISSYIKKYPNKTQQKKAGDLFFWTIRDINALKRNQSFVKKFSANTLIIDKKTKDYYVYLDVFKQFSKHVPYYFGNCNVLIDNILFQKYKKYFISVALNRHPYLQKHFTSYSKATAGSLIQSKQKIHTYFKKLLGKHYII